MNENPSFGSTVPDRFERERREHSIEWSIGWQYAVTHRTLRDLTPEQIEQHSAKVPAELRVPPPGEGWEINVDCHKNGYHARGPLWCKDGTALMQSLHWRRELPGNHPGRRLSVRRDPE